MPITPGFLLFEMYLRRCYCWPSFSIRGFGPIILISITIIWSLYPCINAYKHFKENLDRNLFFIQFVINGLLVVAANIQLFRNRDALHEMINILSDCKQSGGNISKRIERIDNNIKIVLKIVNYAGFVVACFMALCVMLSEKCARFKSTKHCLMFEYYVPFNLEYWHLTLMMLFQIYILGVGINVAFNVVLLYWYSTELVVIRIQELYESIDTIHLTKNKKRNSMELKPIIMCYQNIIFRVFEFVKNFFRRFLVPTKICIICCMAISTTQFALRHNLVSLSMFLMTFVGGLINYTIGQTLTNSADKIAVAVYNLNWTDADVSTRRDLITLLCISQRPLILEVPFFGEISYSAAMNDYKKVYISYNWILTVTKT